MLIVCPSCASQYELGEAKLGPEGRKVGCAGCKTAWHVEPTAFPEPPSEAETQALLAEELERAASVSYTHLDVYKRQAHPRPALPQALRLR